MKIGIIGLGAVGSAIKKGFEYIGHEIYGHDIRYNTKVEDVLSAEIVYICVGTPPGKDEHCDVSAVLNVVEELNNLNYKGIVAVKSTVKPGTTGLLVDKYPNLTISFVPEFLREKCAYEDFVCNNNILVVGTKSDKVYNKIVESHGRLPVHKVKVSIIEAELMKYFSNTYKAMRITFANSFHKIAEHFGANYDVIKDTFLFHGVQEGHYLNVNKDFGGYGGMCLPKDTKAMKALVKELDLNLDVFRFIDEENDKFVKKVPPGMRKDI
jgi:GDP-mannose 6-dehydrogenase|tara:strand:+ start:10967 stop:11767 length:801 start_codon:yes stop_codon:yes gene_type:complete